MTLLEWALVFLASAVVINILILVAVCVLYNIMLDEIDPKDRE